MMKKFLFVIGLLTGLTNLAQGTETMKEVKDNIRGIAVKGNNFSDDDFIKVKSITYQDPEKVFECSHDVGAILPHEDVFFTKDSF